ncbi:MAG: hypothetical protein AAF517_01130 [Planctomycetota bacterium]
MAALPKPLLELLAQVRRRHLLIGSASVLVGALLTAILLFLVATSLDRLFFLTTSTRVSITFGSYAVLATFLVTGIARVFFRRRRPTEIAAHVESIEPRFDDALRTVVELSNSSSSGAHSPELLEDLSVDTSKKAEGLRPGTFVSTRTLGLTSTAAVVAILGVSAWAASDFRSFLAFAHRFVSPSANLPRPTRDSARVIPGTAYVKLGQSVDITVEASPGVESAYFVPATEDATAIRIPKSSRDSAFRYRLGGVQAPIRYRIRAGDWQSEMFSLSPVPAPSPREFSVRSRSPTYLGGLEETTTTADGQIEALVGTVVQVSGVSDRQLSSVRIHFEDGAQLDGRVDGTAFGFPGFPVVRNTWYELELVSAEGVSSERELRYLIDATEDRSPSVEWVTAHRELELEPGQTRGLIYRAGDDVALARVTLLSTAQKTTRETPLWERSANARHETRLLDGSHWVLARDLPAGRVEYQLRVVDRSGKSSTSQTLVVRQSPRPPPPEGSHWIQSLSELRGRIRALQAPDTPANERTRLLHHAQRACDDLGKKLETPHPALRPLQATSVYLRAAKLDKETKQLLDAAELAVSNVRKAEIVEEFYLAWAALFDKISSEVDRPPADAQPEPTTPDLADLEDLASAIETFGATSLGSQESEDPELLALARSLQASIIDPLRAQDQGQSEATLSSILTLGRGTLSRRFPILESRLQDYADRAFQRPSGRQVETPIHLRVERLTTQLKSLSSERADDVLRSAEFILSSLENAPARSLEDLPSREINTIARAVVERVVEEAFAALSLDEDSSSSVGPATDLSEVATLLSRTRAHRELGRLYESLAWIADEQAEIAWQIGKLSESTPSRRLSTLRRERDLLHTLRQDLAALTKLTSLVAGNSRLAPSLRQHVQTLRAVPDRMTATIESLKPGATDLERALAQSTSVADALESATSELGRLRSQLDQSPLENLRQLRARYGSFLDRLLKLARDERELGERAGSTADWQTQQSLVLGRVSRLAGELQVSSSLDHLPDDARTDARRGLLRVHDGEMFEALRVVVDDSETAGRLCVDAATKLFAIHSRLNALATQNLLDAADGEANEDPDAPPTSLLEICEQAVERVQRCRQALAEIRRRPATPAREKLLREVEEAELLLTQVAAACSTNDEPAARKAWKLGLAALRRAAALSLETGKESSSKKSKGEAEQPRDQLSDEREKTRRELEELLELLNAPVDLASDAKKALEAYDQVLKELKSKQLDGGDLLKFVRSLNDIEKRAQDIARRERFVEEESRRLSALQARDASSLAREQRTIADAFATVLRDYASAGEPILPLLPALWELQQRGDERGRSCRSALETSRPLIANTDWSPAVEQIAQANTELGNYLRIISQLIALASENLRELNSSSKTTEGLRALSRASDALEQAKASLTKSEAESSQNHRQKASQLLANAIDSLKPGRGSRAGTAPGGSPILQREAKRRGLSWTVGTRGEAYREVQEDEIRDPRLEMAYPKSYRHLVRPYLEFLKRENRKP